MQADEFQRWMWLARNDPEAFERERDKAVNEVISNAPERLQARLRGLQFRIDMERRKARTPLIACLRISSMMWDAVLGKEGLRDALTSFSSITEGRGGRKSESPRHKAEVIVFRPKSPRP